MKNFNLTLTCLLLLTMFGSNQIVKAQLLIEPFNYTADATNDLSVQSGDVWVNQANGDSKTLVSTGSLSYLDRQKSANKISFVGNTNTYIRQYTASANLLDLYYSFTFRVTNIPASTIGDYFIYLSNSTSGTGVIIPVGIRASATSGKFNVGFGKRAGITDWSAEDLDPNTTYFIVAKYGWNDVNGTLHTAKFWLNPTNFVTEPASDFSSSGSAGSNVNNIAPFKYAVIKNSSENSDMAVEVDEIRVANTWSDISTLPVSFDSFFAEAQNNRTKLTWSTLSEQGNSGFEVERSSDGVNFNLLTTVSGKGSTSEASSYTVYDNSPANGVNYYRLTQVDFNGKKTGLSIASATFKLDDAVSVSVYPNPVSSEINLLLQNYQGSFRAVLSTLDGRVVQQQELKAKAGQSVYVLSLSSKPAPGAYLLKITGDKGLAKPVKIFVL